MSVDIKSDITPTDIKLELTLIDIRIIELVGILTIILWDYIKILNIIKSIG